MTGPPRRNATGSLAQSAALTTVSVTTALGFARVFDSGAFVGLVVVAAVTPHAAGVVARWRGWAPVVSVLLGVAATLTMLMWSVAARTTFYGLPTADTARRVGRLLEHGWSVFRTGIAPVPAATGVVLLCAIAVMIAATAADAIARRPDVTLGALTPTLVLLVLTGTLGTDHLRVLTTCAYVLEALVFLTIADTARIARRRTWFTGRRLASDAGAMRSAALIGGTAIAAALIVTPLVPGIDSPALLSYRSRTGAGSAGDVGDYVGVSPLVDLRARLAERSDIELFRVSAPEPRYWRLLALDTFDGTTWSLTSEARDVNDVLPRRSGRPVERQRFQIVSLADQWLPAAYRPVGTSVGNARAIPESLTLVAPNPVPGLDYLVESVIEEPPTPDEIGATDRPTPGRLADALELPEELSPLVATTAQQVTAGLETPWERAEALTRYFTDGSFTYDLDADLGDGADAIATFLRTRRGFCQQFAATFAAMARAAGLPARVVVGFTPGTYDATRGEYVVRGRDAHAWAEVWMAGLGWRTFEPTPAGTEPGMAVPTAAPPTATAPSPASTTTTAARGSSTTIAGDPNQSAVPRDPRSAVTTSSTPGSGSWSWSWRTVLLVVVVAGASAVAAASLVVLLLRPRRRRRRRHDTPDPVRRVGGAWAEALDACRAAQLPVEVALTPREQVRSLRRHGLPDGAVDPFEELAEHYAQTVWAPTAVTAAASDAAWEASETIARALDDDIGVADRVTRRLRAAQLVALGAPPD